VKRRKVKVVRVVKKESSDGRVEKLHWDPVHAPRRKVQKKVKGGGELNYYKLLQYIKTL
jgi:hypothetical protein